MALRPSSTNKQISRLWLASTGNHDTFEQARILKPDLVLIDLGLGNINGLQVVAALTKKLPQTKVIGMGSDPFTGRHRRVRAGRRGGVLFS